MGVKDCGLWQCQWGCVCGKSADHRGCRGLQAQAVSLGCVAIGGGSGLGVSVPLDIIRQ